MMRSIHEIKPGTKVKIGDVECYLRKIIYSQMADCKNDFKFCFHNIHDQPFNNPTDITISIAPKNDIQLEVIP